MRTIVFYTLAALAATATSCDYTLYRIEMTPRDGQIDRRLTVTREGGPTVRPTTTQPASQPEAGRTSETRSVPADELFAIAKLYPTSTLGPPGGENVFSGAFAERLPSDVGGRGHYLHRTTTLGDVNLYLEDFRSNDEPATVMEKAFAAVDKLADLLAGFLKTKMGTEKDVDKLESFLRGPFRSDLKNLSMYLWLESQERQDRQNPKEDQTPLPSPTHVARVLSFLLARGYIEPDDAPMLSRLFHEQGSPEGGEAVVQATKGLLRRILAEKAGVKNEALAEKTVALFHSPTFAEEFAAYVAATCHLPASRPAQATTRPGVNQPQTANDLLSDLGRDIMMIHFEAFNVSDRVEVSLAAPAPPFFTNGQWDEKTRRIAWSATLGQRNNPGKFLPPVCFALWTRPDAQFQNKHFGKLAVDGSDLLTYWLWRITLTERRGREWDAAVAGMNGPQDLAKLQAFRFSDEPKPPTTKPEDGKPTFSDEYYRKGARLIAESLAPKPATEPAAPTTCPAP